MRTAVLVITLLARVALAETETELAQRGEALAKEGRYSEAIETFKSADRIELRASHACLIALAYVRREAWPQAELWLDTCQKRATPSDPLPDWFAAMTAQIGERLAKVKAAAVDIRVEPADAKARVSVSSFAPDETMDPRTIHLAPGHHVIIARAPGFEDGQAALDVVDTTPQHLVIHLERRAVPSPRAGMPLLYAGGALAIIGAGTYGWMSYEYIQAGKSHDAWSDHIGRYRIAKWTTIGAWSAGAVCLVAGYLWHRSARDDVPVVSAAPIDRGALVVVGWQR